MRQVPQPHEGFDGLAALVTHVPRLVEAVEAELQGQHPADEAGLGRVLAEVSVGRGEVRGQAQPARGWACLAHGQRSEKNFIRIRG